MADVAPAQTSCRGRHGCLHRKEQMIFANVFRVYAHPPKAQISAGSAGVTQRVGESPERPFYLSKVDRLLRRRCQMNRRKRKLSGLANALRTTRSTYGRSLSGAKGEALELGEVCVAG
jgi:hypothetical protein